MINFKIEELDFSKDAVITWKTLDKKHANWPVVYVLDDGQPRNSRLRDIYVGESLSAATRLHQHLQKPEKQHLKNARVIICESFNKSVCLDLESYLIKMMAGDGSNQVLNKNNGITEANYYQREVYREEFRSIFRQLQADGIFTRSIADIENSDLFRLSPFKALTEHQANSVEEIVQGLLDDLQTGSTKSTIVIQGDPGTGKSIVGIFLIKLLVDIGAPDSLEDLDNESRFAHLFTETNQRLLHGLRMGLIVPQQSLRKSIEQVFKTTRGLDPKMVLDVFKAGESEEPYDLLLVDETHRLNQRANQPSANQNTRFRDINMKLFGADDINKTQLDWVQSKSRHQIFLLDAMQGVRPADLPVEILAKLINHARATGRHFQLKTQMRIRAGSDFVDYVRWFLNPHPTSVPRTRLHLGEYDFRTFDTVAAMRAEILRKDEEVGLARIVAGYAWEWNTRKKENKNNKDAFDIEIGETRLRWNSTQTDWIASKNAVNEVGSVHTVQGYDLNYVGVIIGLDLRFDPQRQCLYMDRGSYFDKKGRENNPTLGRTYSDHDLLRFITQIYAVLMTRGIRGTYVYACDPGLRQYLSKFIPSSSENPMNSALNPNSFGTAMQLD
jgi:DUF2075 family protein